jgi:hypothetical protein
MRNPISYLTAFVACSIMALTAGCASGGFKLTRQYAGWVNSQQLIIRIILYILTGVVFAVTLLIDLVVFNTMDFWEGRVSAGDYHFKKEDRVFHVRHEFQPGEGKLKLSTIRVMDLNEKLLQEVVLKQLASGEIEMFVDGKIRARVQDVNDAPVALAFDKDGKIAGRHLVPLAQSIAARN